MNLVFNRFEFKFILYLSRIVLSSVLRVVEAKSSAMMIAFV